eukprot:maker-scaffold1329_size47409-snap-gene-0.11 protein:Tk08799 transcript:maker-scaffold1329_size47409-snap-gene-0.11-mRNA-1 annotation:"dna replication licensing factor mcm8"
MRDRAGRGGRGGRGGPGARGRARSAGRRRAWRGSSSGAPRTPVQAAGRIHAHPVGEPLEGGAYPLWQLYLPTQDLSPSSPEWSQLEAARAFYRESQGGASGSGLQQRRRELYREKRFTLAWPTLLASPVLSQQWPHFSADWHERGEITLGVLGLARHQMLLEELQGDPAQDLAGVAPVPVIRARLTRVEPITPIKDLKTSLFNRTITVRGTVVRVSNAKPGCTWLAFQCGTCAGVQSVYQPYRHFLEPLRCPAAGGGCRGRRFEPLRSHRQSVTVDWQTIRVQELDQCESGRVPRTIEAELTDDLCDSAVPGDVITLTGVVKNASAVGEKTAKASERCVFQLYLHALALENAKSSRSGRDRSSQAGIEFTADDYALVREVHSLDTLIFKLVVHSLCPAIYGHNLVKAGLVLGLFGGSTHSAGDKSSLSVRSDPHILVIGDPGLGKSQMLHSCSRVAPRGVFVTGNTTTTSGLTVTLSRESGNDFALEAGALVLADQGCCCIDEFDKMTSQHQALLEAMEQQSISIAKAGVVCSLPARTAVLAAANPVGGHYNKARTVAENLKLNPALLSRFDLVFILIDNPNEKVDQMLSEHIMRLHQNQSHQVNEPSAPPSMSHGPRSQTWAQTSTTDPASSLARKLMPEPDETIQPIPHHLLRKYIAYARKYVVPKLTPEAGVVLQNFYVELRQQHHHMDSTPITLRQLESLKRLTEARAKVEMREEATEEDARDVVEIMKTSMVDIFSDDEGALDFSRSLNGSGMSSRGAAKKFVAALQRQAQREQRQEFSVDELKRILNGCGARVANFYDFLSSLNTQGYILKKSAKTYQLLSAYFLAFLGDFLAAPVFLGVLAFLAAGAFFLGVWALTTAFLAEVAATFLGLATAFLGLFLALVAFLVGEVFLVFLGLAVFFLAAGLAALGAFFVTLSASLKEPVAPVPLPTCLSKPLARPLRRATFRRELTTFWSLPSL